MNPLRKYSYENKWNIGFVQENLSEILSSNKPLTIKWLKHNCKNSWFADPFIVNILNNDIYILVEEYHDPIKRGRISRLIVDKESYELKQKDTVLELSTHLSFPAILRKGNKIFIYPENSASGKLVMYEYDYINNICTNHQTLSNIPLTDAIITNIANEQYIISTQLPHPNSNILGKYSSNNLIQEFIFDSKIARNAGDWFEYNNKLYRPAQDCNKTYGGAVIIQEVTTVNNTLQFKNIRRIESTHSIYNEGLHTFNFYKNLIVIDAKGYKHPIAHKLYEFLKNIIK